MRQTILDFFKRTRSYLKDSEQEIIANNWTQVRLMTLLYLGMIVLFFVAISLPEGDSRQIAATLIAFAAQSAYSAAIWAKKGPPKTMAGENAVLCLFGAMIIAFAFADGIFIAPVREAWLFPVELILLTQIYTMSPGLKIAEVLCYCVLFAVLSFLNKPTEIARIDMMAAIGSFSVAMVSYFTIMWYRVSAAETGKRLRKMCSVDQMTGVLNKTTFEFYYDEFQRTYRGGLYALAIVDIDSFKRVNDEHGHLSGDAAIQLLTQTIARCMGASWQIEQGRFGGDEFVVLLKSIPDRASAETVFRYFLDEYQAVSEQKLGFPLTASIGAVFLTRGEVPFQLSFAEADRALYCVKNAGGDDSLGKDLALPRT